MILMFHQFKCLWISLLLKKLRFLAQLSQRLNWAFLLKMCLLSVVIVVVVVVIRIVVNFSHVYLLLQNHWANFNQTWHKVSLGEGDSSFFKWRAPPFSRVDNYEIAKIHWILKIFFSRTTGPISTKLWTMHPWVKEDSCLFRWRALPFITK